MFMIFVGRHAKPENDEDEGVLEAAGVALGIGKEENKGSGQRSVSRHFAVTCDYVTSFPVHRYYVPHTST